MRELFDKLQDANVRLEHLLWVPGIASGGRPPDVFCQFFEDVNEGSQIHQALPEIAIVLGWESDESTLLDELAQEMIARKRHGFIFQAATPVTSKHTDFGHSYSWGSYHVEWMYADTLEQMVEWCVKWAAANVALDRENA
jgi:hypothetical protein